MEKKISDSADDLLNGTPQEEVSTVKPTAVSGSNRLLAEKTGIERFTVNERRRLAL
ncbi:MAG: hypothetical protein RQ733_08250 [Methyloprofundus sp.]|nr:hypothetical protein [Methyloprofundus sp.]